MSISSVSSANNSYPQTSQASPLKQAKQDYAALAQALASGNLTGAQQAFTAFQSDLQKVQQASGGAQTVQATQSAQGGVQGDLSSLGQALSSGNMSGAQTAFANLQKDAQAAVASQTGQTHHHHHHHGGGGEQSAATSLTATSSTTTGSGTTTSGSSINTTA